MDRRFNIDSVPHILSDYKARTNVATGREVRKTVRRGNTWPRIRSAVECVTEFVVGVFAGLYVLAALALGGAVLFFTLGH